ncbi:MAG: hypothetical protein ACP5G1_04675, partial [Nanopusillaceae archaeon]
YEALTFYNVAEKNFRKIKISSDYSYNNYLIYSGNNSRYQRRKLNLKDPTPEDTVKMVIEELKRFGYPIPPENILYNRKELLKYIKNLMKKEDRVTYYDNLLKLLHLLEWKFEEK